MSRVLVVDDEKNILATLSIGLKRSDYPVLQARSGPEALEILDNQPCDIVVSDIRMSPMDGYTLAKKINDKYPDVGIVLMSAYGFDDWKPNTADVSQYPRLVKPFEVSELVAVLKEEEAKLKSRRTFSEKLLCVARADDLSSLKNLLESKGGQLEVVDTVDGFQRAAKQNAYDAFIVDSELVNADIGKTLNTIDQLGGDPVVFMLTVKTGEKESAQASDGKVMLLDKEAFINDSDWAIEQLRSHLQH